MNDKIMIQKQPRHNTTVAPNLALHTVLAKALTLTDYGFELHYEYRRLPKPERQKKFDQQRNSLAKSGASFASCCKWIAQNLEKRRTICYKRNSYSLKHIAEKEIGYITNGVFIAAMIASGFEWKVDGPNAFFNVSARSISRLEEEIERQRCANYTGTGSTHTRMHRCARSRN